MDKKIGIVFHGATGSLARSQHLSGLLAIRKEGGLPLRNGDRLIPELLLVGRSEERLAELAAQTGLTSWTTDLDSALSSPDYPVFFDAAISGGRPALLLRAIAAGKHIYSEKPIAGTVDEAMGIVAAAEKAGLRHGTVQDKLFLPGFSKMLRLAQSGFFGRMLEVRIEMGHWVFDGEDQPAQRASWNYRRADGGGLMLDLFPHWRYMIDNIVGPIRAISATTRTHIPRRIDERGEPYVSDVEDSVFTQMEIEGGAVASVNCSWCTRVRREATMVMQVDGTKGSAMATPAACFSQSDFATPRFGRASDGQPSGPATDHWQRLPVDGGALADSYRKGWEAFLRYVTEGGDYRYSLLQGAKGVQLAALGYRSHQERRWIDVPDLSLPQG